jgi:hypothetical protein
MANLTGAGLAKFAKSKKGTPYIYGCKGADGKVTQAKVNSLARTYPSVFTSSYLYKIKRKGLVGKVCCDCSGLISSCTGIERNSTNYKETAKEVIKLSELSKNWNKYIGYGLWMKGHIGVVSEIKDYYYAMDGSNRNMVKYPMNKQNWNCAIKLKDIDYSGGYIDMDEINKKIDLLTNQVFNLINLTRELDKEIKSLKKVYNKIEEIPTWAKPTVEKLINKGYLTGSETGLNISYDLLRTLVINDRAKIYDR